MILNPNIDNTTHNDGAGVQLLDDKARAEMEPFT